MKPILALLLCTLMLSACSRNEFTLDGDIKGGEGTTLFFSWRAASASRDALQSQAVPLTGSPFVVKGGVKFPSVIWVFSMAKQPLFPIYVERGDKLTLRGDISSPGLWRVKGNKVMEQITEWSKENADVLRAASNPGRNRAIAEYVRKHPGERSALFLLLTRYERNNSREFTELMNLVPDSDMKVEMMRACLEAPLTPEVLTPAQRRVAEEALAPDTASIR